MSTNEMKDKALSLSSLTSLPFSFTHPPLLVGGMALMYYGLRESGKDIDFIIHPEDHINLALSFKERQKSLRQILIQALKKFLNYGIYMEIMGLFTTSLKFGIVLCFTPMMT